MKGNFHARFCSRARVATPWLRQPHHGHVGVLLNLKSPALAARGARERLDPSWEMYTSKFPSMGEALLIGRGETSQGDRV